MGNHASFVLLYCSHYLQAKAVRGNSQKLSLVCDQYFPRVIRSGKSFCRCSNNGHFYWNSDLFYILIELRSDKPGAAYLCCFLRSFFLFPLDKVHQSKMCSWKNVFLFLLPSGYQFNGVTWIAEQIDETDMKSTLTTGLLRYYINNIGKFTKGYCSLVVMHILVVNLPFHGLPKPVISFISKKAGEHRLLKIKNQG